MNFKNGDKVIITNADAIHDIINDFGKHPFYMITNMRGDYIRVNGAEAGWRSDCFEHYKDNLLPDELFEL